MSAVIRPEYPDKDLTTVDGLTRTLEFETLDDHEGYGGRYFITHQWIPQR
jgi:hypothetical protein